MRNATHCFSEHALWLGEIHAHDCGGVEVDENRGWTEAREQEVSEGKCALIMARQEKMNGQEMTGELQER